MDSRTAAPSSVDVLIEAVGRGSPVALKRLYDVESRRLYGIALRIARRPEIAADVLQEAFLQIWQNAATFSAERGAGAA
jgi:RNA polymerase sigma-70 factor (ECF subfamily)